MLAVAVPPPAWEGVVVRETMGEGEMVPPCCCPPLCVGLAVARGVGAEGGGDGVALGVSKAVPDPPAALEGEAWAEKEGCEEGVRAEEPVPPPPPNPPLPGLPVPVSDPEGELVGVPVWELPSSGEGVLTKLPVPPPAPAEAVGMKGESVGVGEP